MKKILLPLLFTLIFTGCVERGQTLKPAPVPVPVPVKPIKLKATQALIKVKSVEIKKSKTLPTPIASVKIKDDINTEPVRKNIVSPTQTPPLPVVNVEDNSLFPLSDETKNKISGFFILIIGIIILL